MPKKSFQEIPRVLLAMLLCGGFFLNVAGCDSGYSEEAPISRLEAGLVATAPRPKVGASAPEFRLLDMNGQSMALSDLRGKVVVLNFWATWCFPCRVEMPSLEAIYQDYRSQGLEILAVSVDEQGPTVTRPFQEDKGLTFPILHDRDYQVGLLYGARSLPMTYVIDRKGIIRQRVFGSREWDSLESRELILEMLHKSGDQPAPASSHMM